ncbi:MAG: ISAs1 family transposase, partial [Deltaproteobacteria bacterium]|nr:ISAs1 family transposase [Deltaproteobacteria bacterium]
EALEDWGRKEARWLSGFLHIPHGTPSQDVYLRVFAALDRTSFRMAFHAWMQEGFSLLGLDSQVAIDGQTHRRSGDARSGTKPLHMVHALLCEAGLVVGQLATEEKSNEITAIPALLDVLDLSGALVSIDAMGTQVKIARKIVDGGGDYLLGLKGNQTNLHTEVQEAFAEALDDRQRAFDEEPPAKLTEATEVDGGDGRIETRIARVLEGFEPWVPSGKRWKGLKSLVAITATCEDVITGKISEETRYYISSRLLTPTEANKAVRAHWQVENRLHWCLDMSFGQDACRIRSGNATANFAVVRHFALNIIRAYKEDQYSVPRRRRLCDFHRDYRERVLRSMANA